MSWELQRMTSDRAAHELLGPDGSAVGDVLAEFGSQFGTMKDGIDRQALGNEVLCCIAKTIKVRIDFAS